VAKSSLGNKVSLCIDHDHKTGKFRGWLCFRCNQMAGKSDENIVVLKNIVAYLEKHHETIER